MARFMLIRDETFEGAPIARCVIFDNAESQKKILVNMLGSGASVRSISLQRAPEGGEYRVELEKLEKYETSHETLHFLGPERFSW
jgi:hypothetical protein